MDFPGSLVLVTHDRYMLDRIATVVLGLNGKGAAERFADYPQWEEWQKQARQSPKPLAGTPAAEKPSAPANAPAKRKLSYMEAREYAGIEQRIADAEQQVQAHRAELEDPANATDAARLLSAQAAFDAAQKELDALYHRWSELEDNR
jgi:ABC transport system ATP-binding/permease protein